MKLAPQILSPKEEIVYHLRSIGSDSKQIPLLAVSDGNIKVHSWYINNRFIGKSDTGESLLWRAVSGIHDVRVIDEEGRSADIKFQVRWID